MQHCVRRCDDDSRQQKDADRSAHLALHEVVAYRMSTGAKASTLQASRCFTHTMLDVIDHNNVRHSGFVVDLSISTPRSIRSSVPDLLRSDAYLFELDSLS